MFQKRHGKDEEVTVLNNEFYITSAEEGIISEYEKGTVIAMSKKVLEALTEKYTKVQEGVKKIMGGQILDYEAKRIRNEERVHTERERKRADEAEKRADSAEARVQELEEENARLRGLIK